LGLVLIAATVPQFFVGLVGGAVADRLSRKAIVIVSYLVSGAMLTILWLLPGEPTPPLAVLVGAVAVVGVATSIVEPAQWALIPHLVEADAIRLASTVRTIADQLTQIVGPAFAGIVVALAGAQVWFAIDAVTFALAAVVFAAVPAAGGDRAPHDGRRPPVVTELRSAAWTIARVPWLRTGVLAGALANLLLVAPLGVAVPLIIQRGGLGATTFGWFSSLLGVGTVAGALVANLLARTRPVERACVLLAAGGVVAALIGALPGTAQILAFGVVLGALLAMFEVIWNAFELSNVDDNMLAKALAGDQWLSFTLRTVGLVALTPASTAAPGATMIVSGLVLAVVALALAASDWARGDRPPPP
jgi:MFS family permease